MFDASRVRIELCDVMTFSGGGELTCKQGADIWLSDGSGKILRTRKPAAQMVADSRPELLRQIAGWIEQEGDEGLTKLAAGIREMRGTDTSAGGRRS
jgi:hypothetical protein